MYAVVFSEELYAAAQWRRRLLLTVRQDKAGADESLKIARDRIQKNAADTGVGAPAVTEGTVVVQI